MGNGFKLKENRLDIKKDIFYNKDENKVEVVAQRSSGCPIPGSVLSQVGCGFKKSGPVEDVLAHDRIRLDDF